MPLDMAVEEPHARVVRLEADDKVAVALDDEGVAADRVAGETDVAVVGERAGVFLGAVDDLELVAVEMEGVLAVVFVVEDDFNDFVVLEDVGDGVCAVDAGVRCVVGADGEGAVKGGDLGEDVGFVVEEGAIGLLVVLLLGIELSWTY